MALLGCQRVLQVDQVLLSGRGAVSVQLHEVWLLADGAVLLKELTLDLADLRADLAEVLHDGEHLLPRSVELVLELLDGDRGGLLGLLLGVSMELAARRLTGLDASESGLIDLVDGLTFQHLLFLLVNLELDRLLLLAADGRELLRVRMSAGLLL